MNQRLKRCDTVWEKMVLFPKSHLLVTAELCAFSQCDVQLFVIQFSLCYKTG